MKLLNLIKPFVAEPCLPLIVVAGTLMFALLVIYVMTHKGFL